MYEVQINFGKFWKCGFYDWRLVSISEDGKLQPLEIIGRPEPAFPHVQSYHDDYYDEHVEEEVGSIAQGRFVVHARGSVVDGVIGWRNSTPRFLARRRIENAHPPGLAGATEHLVKSGYRHAAAVMADRNAYFWRHKRCNLAVLEPPVRLLCVTHIAFNG